jgi:hypothetical protein
LKRLREKTEPPQIIFRPAGTSQNLPDGFGAKGLIQVMIDEKHPTSIRVLIDVVGATGLSAPKALGFDSSNPFPGCAISEGGDIQTTGRARE